MEGMAGMESSKTFHRGMQMHLELDMSKQNHDLNIFKSKTIQT